MANTGKKVSNSLIAEGVSWDDRYNITGSQRDKAVNVARVVGSDVTGSQWERAIVWSQGTTPTDFFNSASLVNQFPVGTVVFDVTKKEMKLLSGSQWYSASFL